MTELHSYAPLTQIFFHIQQVCTASIKLIPFLEKRTCDMLLVVYEMRLSILAFLKSAANGFYLSLTRDQFILSVLGENTTKTPRIFLIIFRGRYHRISGFKGRDVSLVKG